jgi:hypothetical protein
MSLVAIWRLFNSPLGKIVGVVALVAAAWGAWELRYQAGRIAGRDEGRAEVRAEWKAAEERTAQRGAELRAQAETEIANEANNAPQPVPASDPRKPVPVGRLYPNDPYERNDP